MITGEEYRSREKLAALIRNLALFWLIPDTDVIKVMLAGVVAHYFETDPLWIFLIAPASSLKTELISSLDGWADIYQLSSLTPQTLFSGLKKGKDQKESNSILVNIGDKILTLKDFGTVLSMRHEDRAVILAQLREIYDGSFVANYGSGVTIKWKGRIGMIAGVTPAIDTHYAVFQILGERFIQYRLKAVAEGDLTDKALADLGREPSNRMEARDSVALFLQGLEVPPIGEIEIPVGIRQALGSLAAFCVRARSGVVRDHYKKTLEYIPAPEAPARLVKQLAVLACALAVLEGRKKVTLTDYLLVLRVGFDCIPRQRMAVLELLATEDREFTTTEVAEGVNYSPVGVTAHLEDLTAHKLVRANRRGSGFANQWRLSKRTKRYLGGMISPKGKEKLKNKLFKKDRCYAPILNLILKLPPLQACKNKDISTGGRLGKTLKKRPDHQAKEEKQDLTMAEREAIFKG